MDAATRRALPDLETYIDVFVRCVLTDAMRSATARYWHRRADQFERSAPRQGDFLGQSMPEERAERERIRLARIDECRARAQSALIQGDTEEVQVA